MNSWNCNFLTSYTKVLIKGSEIVKITTRCYTNIKMKWEVQTNEIKSDRWARFTFTYMG